STTGRETLQARPSVALRKFVSPGNKRHCERSEAIQRAWCEPRRTPGLDCFVALRAPRNDKCFPDVVNFRTRTLPPGARQRMHPAVHPSFRILDVGLGEEILGLDAVDRIDGPEEVVFVAER